MVAETVTPAQRAYEAWRAVLAAAWLPRHHVPWEETTPLDHAAWEAAAQAVLEACAMLCPICGAELERCNAEHTP